MRVKKNMDIAKSPIEPKYLKPGKVETDEHIYVENSFTTGPSVCGSNDNVFDVRSDSANEPSDANTSGEEINVESFKEKCLYELKNTSMLDKIIDKLYESGD